MTEKQYAELIKWPTKADEMTVDLMMRIVACDTQVEYLSKWKDIESDPEAFKKPLYHARTLSVISGVGLMACLWALREADPEKAEEFVRDYWRLCDAGDSFGEMLWEFAEKAGLDLELVKLHAPPAQSGTGTV